MTDCNATARRPSPVEVCIHASMYLCIHTRNIPHCKVTARRGRYVCIYVYAQVHSTL